MWVWVWVWVWVCVCVGGVEWRGTHRWNCWYCSVGCATTQACEPTPGTSNQSTQGTLHISVQQSPATDWCYRYVIDAVRYDALAILTCHTPPTCSCVMLAVVRAEKVTMTGVHLSLGSVPTRCRLMHTLLPVPVGPTINSGWPCCRHVSSRKVYLR